MQELSTKWDTLDTNTKQYIALTSSGANQIQNFYALMSNFGTAIDATNTALQASGSAWRENAKYMESIEAKTQKLKTALEELVLGSGALDKLIKGFLDASTAIVKFIDNSGGLITVIGALTSALILLNSGAIMKLTMSLPMLASQIKTLTLGYIEFASTATAWNEIMTASIPVVGLLILAMTALFAVANNLANATEKSIEKISELNQKIEMEQGEINEITNEINQLKDRLEELNKIDNPTFTDQKEIDNLNYEIGQLERELALKQAINEEDKRKAEKEANKVVFGSNSSSKTVSKYHYLSAEDDFATTMGIQSGVLGYEMPQQFDTTGEQYYQQVITYTDRLNALKERANELTEENNTLTEQNNQIADKNSAEYQKNTKAKQENEKQLKLIDKQITMYNSMLLAMTQELKNATEGLDENSLAYRLAKQSIDYFSDSLLSSQTASEKQAMSEAEISTELEKVRQEYGLTDKQYQELQDTVEEAIANKDDEEDAYIVAKRAMDAYLASIKEQQDLMSDWNKQLDNLQSNYKTLTEAVQEYNTTGQFSVDTVQDLLSLSPEYLAMLVEENGQLKINEEALKAKTLEIINEAKAKIYEEGAERLNQIAQRDSTAVTRENTQAVKENTQANLDNAKSSYEKAKASAEGNKKNLREVKEVNDDIGKRIKALDDLALNLGKDFKKTFTDAKTSASQAKTEVNALKSSVEALKQEVSDMNDELDKYKKAISYIKGKLDDEIDSLKEQRDIEVKLLEDKIEALEDAKRLDEDRHKEEIRLLEEERDLIINTTKEQIETLKERKEQEEEYWNNKIQALKDQNEALEEQS